MNTIAGNIRSLWNGCGMTVDRCMKAAVREYRAFEKGWAEAEAYWIQHPETRPELHADGILY